MEWRLRAFLGIVPRGRKPCNIGVLPPPEPRSIPESRISTVHASDRAMTSRHPETTERTTPLVLLIDDEEWTARSLESILKPEGYAVLRAYTGSQAVELVSKVLPDVLLVDFHLPDITGVNLCSRLRELHTIRPSTPILIFSSGRLTRQDELDAFDAGAWGILSPPFNPQELLGRLQPLVAAKRDVDHVLESSFLDPLTGFYNVQGLMRRIAEISAETGRSGRPLAWVVLGPSRPSEDGVDLSGPTPDLGDWVGPKELTRALGELLTASTRSSDAVGRVGDSDFLIVAPGTDEEGALKLAERVLGTLDKGTSKHELLARLEMMARFYSASGSPSETVHPEEVLRRATSALRQKDSTTQKPPPGSRVRPFSGN